MRANFISCSSLIPDRFASSKDCLNEPKLVIRHAYFKDIYELAEVLTQSFYSYGGLLCWLYPLFKLGVCEDLKNRLNSRSADSSCLVALKNADDGDGEIVGTAEVGLRSSSFLSTSEFKYPYISNLAVKTSCRRQGIARQLLEKCEQIALLWGFSEICLHVLENNHRAKQLYFTNGYKIKQIESSLSDYLTQRPRRLLLNKQLHSDNSVSDSQLLKHNDILPPVANQRCRER
jgi:ribosomal protein S18 acetylase RimI-like enzyme